ncbi:MAG TPA: Calx-beta domain-containing protein, partial [Candidatus Saccharimonadales bacterium]|nr:Calx-beta domain-containing protein [Candidatus Saccharimonadales bacterium]
GGTIYDNDPTPSVSINDVSVVEGDSGFTNAVFTLTLSAPSGRSTSVTYTTEDQGATAGVDYAATTAVVSFSPGQTTQTIRVRVFGDTEAETNETFAVRLTNILGGIPLKERGICTILADDPGPVIAPAATEIVSDSNHNHVIDPAERVTVQFGLYNAGPVGTANLVATLQSGQGVNAPDGPQTYGVLNPHGAPVSRAFSFTASGVNGGTVVATLHLQDGETDLGAVTFSFLLGPRSEFHIVSLSTNQCAAIEHVLVTGDDRGGIAASSSKVFCTGDDVTGRFSLDDLSGGASVGARYEALTSNLRTETAYVLGNGSVPLSSGGGLATSLLQLDEQTGALNGGRINLSASIDLSYGTGLFAGYDRVVVHTGNHGYEISLPSGSVRDLGSLPALNHTSCESWAYWGVAEHEGSTLYLVYVKDSRTIVRTRLPDGLTTVVETFSYLGDMCSITVSISRRRWYFHEEGYSQFRSGDETLGFCDASFSFGTVPVLDHFGWSAVPRARLVGQAIPVTVTARDQFDDVYTNFNAPVTLSGTAAGGEAVHTLLDAPVPAYTNTGSYTMGYSFTPSTNLSVTHVRHIAGTKVTIWTDDGRPLLVMPVISTPDVWLETPLSAPLQLQAGTRYRLGVYTGGDSGVAYYRYDLGNAFPDGSIDESYQGFGDTFPNLRGGPRWLVDLRYAVAADRPVSITPVASPNFFRGVWAGSVTVLEPGTNVVLHAADPSSHRGATTPFRVLAASSGQLDHFEWAPIASPQTMDAPFPATITAKTDLDETLAGFSGTVALSGYGLSPGSYTLWGDGGPDSSLNNGNYTLGYAFTPTANLLVTHVRPFSGTKVSIWDNAGALLVSVPVGAGPGRWSETPLSAPLLLVAGNTYRIGFLTGTATYYQRNTSPGAFANGTIEGSFYAAGDDFPDNPFATGWWLVDLRYEASAFTGLPLQPVTSANFVGGTWTGDLTVLQGATDVVLHADAGGGRVGESNPFTVMPAPAPRLAISRVGDAVVLSWPAEATRYTLETAASLSNSPVWFPAGLAPVVTGDRRMVTNSLSGPGLFFRLNRQ